MQNIHRRNPAGGVNNDNFELNSPISNNNNNNNNNNSSSSSNYNNEIKNIGESPILININEESISNNVIDKKSIFSTTLMLPLLVCFWYVAAIVSITTSKKIMLQTPLPFSLCTIQFFIATIVTTLIKKIKSNLSISLSNEQQSSQQLPFTLSISPAISKENYSISSYSQRLVYLISITYTCGFIFTNIAFRYLSILLSNYLSI
jgi:hypothetical protein